MLDRIQQAQQRMESACRTIGRTVRIMEVCGTHTVAIFRNGIRSMLPANLKLLSGPGCPVCVTEQSYIDNVLRLADRDDCIIATYGDMIRVPGRTGSLEKCQRKANVKVIFSSQDALQIAKDNPTKAVVFVAVGFETTAPATAVVVKQAVEQNIHNFFVLSGHKLVVPAMKALLTNKNNNIDAFLCPGHVSAVIGYGAFAQIVEQFHRPCVVAGFEPIQILEGLAEICEQLAQNRPQLTSVYRAVVTGHGNLTAQKLIAQYFDQADGYWRGLGEISKSTLKLKDRYSRFDAAVQFELDDEPSPEPAGCRCGEVLCGLIDPPACSLFAKTCTPQQPIGPCMVSSEGACAAWFKYHPQGESTG